MTLPSWPTSLLNASNRRLREEIENKTATLAAVQQASSESRSVVQLLRESITEVEKEKKLAAREISKIEENLIQQAAEVTQFTGQISGALHQRKQKEEEYARLTAVKQRTAAAISQRREALRQQLQASRELEEVAKVVIEYGLAQQRKGDALEAAKKKLSSSVWQKLSKLHAEVVALEQELIASQDEQEAAFRELTVAQQRLHEALRDHRENVGSLEKVHEGHRSLDLAVAACAAKMAALQTTKDTYVRIQRELTEALAARGQEQQQLVRARERARSAYDKRLLAVRHVVEALQRQAEGMDALHRRHRAELQRQRAQQSTTQLVHARWQDAQTTLAQQQQYHQLLKDTITAIRRQLIQHPTPSPEAIQSLFDTLEQHRNRVENRLERMHVRLNAAVQQLFEAGEATEVISHDIAERQGELKVVARQMEEHRAITQQLRELSSSVDADIAAARAGLPALMEKQAEQSHQRRVELETNVAALRDELQRYQVRHRHLLQETTTLRSQHMHAQRQVSEGNTAYERALAAVMTAERDVSALAAEASAVEQRRGVVGLTAERTEVTLRALMQAADAQCEAVKTSAGLGDLLRAQVVSEEEAIEAERQAALLELHLQQNALHEHTDEWQRCIKKRDLIRQRYEETMAALSRTMEARMHTEATNLEDTAAMPSTLRAGALGTGDGTALATPEALHARLILQRSYEREQLMRRGNTLDLRLLGLEKETAALRRTLEALRVECQARPGAALAALKRRSHSVGHFGADRTNRAPAPRTASTHPKALAAKVTPTTASVTAAPNTASRAARTHVALTSAMQDRSRALQTEVAIESQAASALSRCRLDSKRELERSRQALQEAKVTSRQKQTQLQRLRDEVRRQNLKAVHSGQ